MSSRSVSPSWSDVHLTLPASLHMWLHVGKIIWKCCLGITVIYSPTCSAVCEAEMGFLQRQGGEVSTPTLAAGWFQSWPSRSYHRPKTESIVLTVGLQSSRAELCDNSRYFSSDPKVLHGSYPSLFQCCFADRFVASLWTGLSAISRLRLFTFASNWRKMPQAAKTTVHLLSYIIAVTR